MAIDWRPSTILADVDHLPWTHGGYGLADFISDRLVMRETIPGDMYDHDSKSERRKVVLMFKPVVDRQEDFATPLQAFHQDVVGQASPSQPEDSGDSVAGFQQTRNARVYALIKHDAQGVTGRRAIRPNALAPRREGRSPVGASHWGNRRERRRECRLPRGSQERSEPGHACRKSRGAMHDVRIHSDDFIEAQFLHHAHPPKDKAKGEVPASIMVSGWWLVVSCQ